MVQDIMSKPDMDAYWKRVAADNRPAWVDQTAMHDPPRSIGNCHAACLASLVSCPIGRVPEITTDDVPDASGYHRRIAEWLGSIGLQIVRIPADPGATWLSSNVLDDDPDYYIASGPTDRGGTLHSIIMRGTRQAHDPHLSRCGILSVDCIEILAPLRPWEWIRGAISSQARNSPRSRGDLLE